MSGDAFRVIARLTDERNAARAARDAAVARAEAAEQALQRVRAETAEAIAQAIEEEARPTHEHIAILEGLDINARARVIIACDHAARIAREHAQVAP